MEAALERLAEGRVALDVTVPPADMERGLDEAYRRIVGRVNIPGFRRGKAPRGIVERFVGRARLLEEAIDPIVQRAYAEAVAQAAIEPVSEPELEVTEFEDGKPLRFKATVTVKPEVELGDYAGIAVPYQVEPVGEVDVDRALDELRERRARWVPVEGEPAAEGMLVVLDVTGEVNGEPTDPERGVAVVIGGGQLRPELDAVVRGVPAGESREVTLSFPSDDADKKLAGQTGHFLVSLREVKRKELPELDDELARELAEAIAGGDKPEVASVEELRAMLKNRLRQVAEARAEDQFGDAVAQAVAEQARVDIPPVLIERQVESALRDLSAQLERGGTSLEAYLNAEGKAADDLKADLRPAAEKRVKTRLVLEAIAKREGLEPSNDEVRQRTERLAAVYGQSAGAFRKVLQRPGNQAELRGELRLEKAVSFLKERARANAGVLAGEA